MQTSHIAKSAQRQSADVLVVPVWEGKKKGELATQDCTNEALNFPLESGDFRGKAGESLLLYVDKEKEKRVLLLGLGLEKECTSDTLRSSYAKSVTALRGKKFVSANFMIPSFSSMPRETGCFAIFEGVLLANYAFDKLKGEAAMKEKKNQLQKAAFCGISAKEGALLEKAVTLVSAVNTVRDLVNGNADDVHVGTLSKLAKELEKHSSKVKTTVLDKKQLEQHGMGLLLAVGQGATRDPALVIIEYKGNPQSKDTTAIIGKGITFDTGGLNLKPTGGIETMKCDMAGAATALGVIQAAVDLGLKSNIIGVMTIAENAIGPASYKPGDVYRSHAGITVEISNTDAEGRLVLADAFSYIQEKYKPSRMIDLATLTGGIVIALGEDATGLFCNDDTLARGLEKAAERTDERVWRMPLYPEYKDLLKSSIADLKNSGGKKASSCSAAMFLKQFIKDTPWAHLDIAGTAFLSDKTACHPTYATGVGLRLIIDFLEHLHDRKA